MTSRKSPQLVAGLSKNHLAERKPHLLEFIDFIESADYLKYFDKPEQIVIWNVGQEDEFQEMCKQLNDLAENRIKLDFRQFEFKKFPKHVKTLGVFSWKMIIDAMMLTEFGSVWWIDASISPLKGKIKFNAENKFPKYEVLSNMI